MVSHNNSTHRQPGRVARLYRDLDNAVRPLAGDRLEALGELLTMADLKTKPRPTIKELSAKLDDGQDLETKLRSAIKASGLTHYAIGKAAAVTPDSLDRFVSGQRGLTLTTASKVANVLGLGLFQLPETMYYWQLDEALKEDKERNFKKLPKSEQTARLARKEASAAKWRKAHADLQLAKQQSKTPSSSKLKISR